MGIKQKKGTEKTDGERIEKRRKKEEKPRLIWTLREKMRPKQKGGNERKT